VSSGRSAKILNLPTKANQIDHILFSRAAKGFGIRQQKQLKLTVFCPPRSEIFGFANKRN
jgi:hypothetical protein